MKREEAIARIREAMPTLWKGTRDAIQTLIPELAESEDERIRKWLIEEIKATHDYDSPTSKKCVDDALAYLEKQKYEYEVFEPIENTLEYKAGFKAGVESEKQKESLHITEMCKENADSFTDEDERIRKAIVELVKRTPSSMFDADIEFNWIGASHDEILAWLEKKKVNTEGDFGRGYDCGYQAGYAVAMNEMKPKVATAALDSEKQKEQKPNIELIQRSWYMEGYHDREFGKEPKWIVTTGEGGPRHEENPKYGEMLAEQKPAERSLEDDHIFGFVYDLLNEIEWKDNWAMSKDECLRLLSNYSPQKPAEWSEEDDAFRDLLICILKYEHPNGIFSMSAKHISALKCNVMPVDRIIAWLKSLRSHWKPSKEQMGTLKQWLQDHELDGDSRYVYPIFYSLFADLQNYFSHEIH